MSWRQMFSKNMERIGFYFCPKKHTNVTNYLVENYQHFKKLNPFFTFLIRDNVGQDTAYVKVNYSFGRQNIKKLDDLNEDEINGILRELVEEGAFMEPLISRPAFENNILREEVMGIDIVRLPEEQDRQEELSKDEIIEN